MRAVSISFAIPNCSEGVGFIWPEVSHGVKMCKFRLQTGQEYGYVPPNWTKSFKIVLRHASGLAWVAV